MIPGIVAKGPDLNPNGPTQWTVVDGSAFPGGASTNWQLLMSNQTDTLFICGVGSKMFLSTDSGSTWSAVAQPVEETAFIRNGAWVSAQRWICAGNSSSAVYYVTGNNGTSWLQKTFPFTATGSPLFFVDAAVRSRVLVSSGANLYLSTDSGDTFSSTPVTTFSNTVSYIASNGAGTLLALLNANPIGRYSISTDNGATWGAAQQISATNPYVSAVWNGTYWVCGTTSTTAPILYSATAGSGTWLTAVANTSCWSLEYNSVDGSLVAVGDVTTTPSTSRNSITTWVTSPVSGTSGIYLRSASAGNYWLAAGGGNVIRAPRAR